MSAVGHERKDADVISIAMIAVMLLLTIVVCLMLCWGALRVLNREREASESNRQRTIPPAQEVHGSRLLVDPGSEREQTRAREKAELNSYGWVDRQGGIVRIPVTRAMQLLVERGLPAVGTGRTRLQLMQARPETNVEPNDPINGPTPEATP